MFKNLPFRITDLVRTLFNAVENIKLIKMQIFFMIFSEFLMLNQNFFYSNFTRVFTQNLNIFFKLRRGIDRFRNNMETKDTKRVKIF
jgi:hypothetical protein